MRYPLLITSAAMLLIACGGDTKQYQKPENSAMSSVHVPLFDGITEIMQDKPFKRLRPGTTVYFMPDTAIGNGVKYVKVTWSDSTAYARADLLMPRGRLAVVTATDKYSSTYFYDSPNLDKQVESVPANWGLTVAGEPVGNATPVLYPGMEGHMLIGYVGNDYVLTAQENIDFYNDFQKALRIQNEDQGNMLRSVATNPRYTNLMIYDWQRNNLGIDYGDLDERGDSESGEDDSPYAEGDAEYGDYYDEAEEFAREQGWTMFDAVLPESESPGTYKTYFVFEDGSEMDAEGLRLVNSYPWTGTQRSGDKIVKKVRFEVTPKVETIVSVSIETFYQPGSEYNTQFEVTGDVASPKNPFSAFVEDVPQTMIFCSVIRAKLNIGQKSAIATVRGQCGDQL